MANFVHLRVHTEYSLSDGIVRIKKLIEKIGESQMPAVAITDISNFFGLIKFYNQALAAGIKPILGADLWIENEQDDADPFLMTVLACTNQGYRNLTELMSDGYQSNQRKGRPQVKADWLHAKQAGLILLSGARNGDVGQALLRGKAEQAESCAQRWQASFGDRYYLELQRTRRDQDEALVQGSLLLARKHGIPVVATNAVMFIARDDFEAHETRVCINEGVTLDDPKRNKHYSEEQYLKSADEMTALFVDIPEALDNSLLVAQRCSAQIELGKYYLPDYPVPAGKTMDEYFRELSAGGLEKRLAVVLKPDQLDFQERRQDYYDRLEFELNIIIQMGFPGYFLIVMDFIRWGKNNGVPVGPGRGSGAGSLVAWVLDITDLDPLEYDLLFERFLNPERVSMPDFDIDFCMDGRERVIQYVAD
ncbi:MAG: DNA polymerase III subunit alpha, partial [Reinekea forsetii]|nr:DNA polymerase III subunit alpha [Reinekea forsetii]